MLRQYPHFVRVTELALIHRTILRPPTCRLIAARYHQKQSQIGMPLYECKDGIRRHTIKAERTAGAESTIAVGIQRLHRIDKAAPQALPCRRGHEAVPGEYANPLQSQSSSSSGGATVTRRLPTR